MNKEIKAKWVAALRGGEYQQVAEALQAGDGFCCLGVLCDLYAKERGKGEFVREFEAEDEALPVGAVAYWAGLPDRNPRLNIGGVLAPASEHNDGWKEIAPKSFAEIADAIEAQL